MDRTDRTQRKRMHSAGILLLALLLILGLAGCGSGGRRVTYGNSHYYTGESQQEVESTQGEVEESRPLFLITAIDNTEETLRLYRFENDLEYQYHYGLDTQFLDKYGNHASTARFTPGRIVVLGEVNASGRLEEVQIADSVWEYDDVSKFSVNQETGIFKIADTKYSYGENLFLFSDSDTIGLDQISPDDTLSIIGVDRRILSVMVTTGHGTLSLTNTELFDGSYLQLDNKVFAEITSGLTMDLPEGTYTLAVANDGWGGSQEITISRGQTTQVDLDTIKGEGPKYGNILFAVDVVGATLKIDGKTVDYTDPIELRYGAHVLKVEMDGYDDWTRTLYVNSKEATILIELSEATQSSGTSSGNSGSSGDSKKDSETEEDTEDSSSTEADVMEDYLSTLTELLASLT